MTTQNRLLKKGGGEGSKRRVGFSPPEGWGLTVG